MKELDSLLQGDIFIDGEEDYWAVASFDTEEEEKLGVYNYLWISEKFFLQGMNIFLNFANLNSQRSHF